MSTKHPRLDIERILWCIVLLGFLLYFLVQARKPKEIAPPLSPEVRSAMVDANNDFGFQLFNVLAGRQIPNLMISPANLEVGLGVLANGAGGATRQQMDAALEWQTHLPPAQGNQALQMLAGELLAADPQVNITAANALWIEKRHALTRGFQQLNATYFNTKVFPAHFSDPSTVSAMNTWVSHQTLGAIPMVAAAGEFNANTQLIALNALAVKNAWQEKFDPTLTTEDTFTLPDGTSKNVNLMHRDGNFLYAEDDRLQIVKLPCGEGNVSMVIMLPRPGQTLNAIGQATFQVAPWSQLLARLQPHEGQLALPRCKIISNSNLAGVLPQLGMIKAFAPALADFSALSASLCSLSQVRHTIALEINESGDRSSTPLERRLFAPGANLPTAPFTMIVDRPFLFAYLAGDGAVLLLGTVTAPEWRDVRRMKSEE